MFQKEKEAPFQSLELDKLDDETPVTFYDSQFDTQLKVDGGWVKRLQSALAGHKREVRLVIIGGAVFAAIEIAKALKKREKKD